MRWQALGLAKGIFVRGFVLGLIALVWVAALQISPAIGQNRPGDVPLIAEPPPANRGQHPSPSGTTRTPTEASQWSENRRVEPSPLDTILLRDSKGNLVPVVGIPFEEFEQLLRAKKGLSPATPPAYTLETVSIAGKAADRRADLKLTATIRVRESGWIRVPLHLAGAVVREPMQHDGPGEYFLAYDATAEGYVCWLNGNDGSPHVVSISFSLPIHSSGEEQRLAMSLPRATESSLRIIEDSPDVDASLTAGDGIASSRALENGSAEITVAGAAGDIQLAWRPRRKLASSQVQLDASGEIAVRIHSEHRIAADARLRVRSYGSPIESFRVRLPPGMELISTTSVTGYSVAVVDPDTKDNQPQKTTSAQQTVVVRLDKPAPSVEVLLRAQREADSAATGWFSPAQFSVAGAVRQRGTIDFAMDGEWQLDWKDDKSVHRVELMPDTAAARVVARYEYFRQPCGLAVKVSARPSRLSVEPVHRIYVEAEQVRIESLLKYRFRGARADNLSFEMGDWVFDRLSPDGLLDFPAENAENKGEVRVPFRPGVAPPSDLELKLQAHRPLSRDTDRLELEFPRPRADVLIPATIFVFAADNIELTPQYDQIHGLSPEAGLRPPEKERPTLIFRDLGVDRQTRFVASVRALNRVTNTSARATVHIDRQQIQVTQRIEYEVSHESQREFVLLAPREVASSDSWDVEINGQSSPAQQLPRQIVDDERLVRLQVTATEPLLGRFTAAIRYSLPLAWDRASVGSLTLPLVLPVDDGDGSFSSQHVQFELADDTTIEPEQMDNEDLPQPVSVRATPNSYSWEVAASFSQWSLVAGRTAATAGTHVSQMWIQTWLGAEMRHDRVALRVSTRHDSLRIRLPPGVRQSSIQAAVDSEKVDASKGRLASPTSAGEITIPLKNDGRECVVEIWYSLEPPPRRLGICHGDLRTMQIPDAEAPRRVYWQLVTLPDEHLITFPQQLSAEMAWSANRLQMFRRPILDQRQLESWMKASRQDLLPYTSHEYLFGAVGRWPTLVVRTARSSAIIGLASAVVLLIGLALLNFPVLRRAELLFPLAVGLAAGGLVWPDTAIIVGQAATVGMAIVALMILWNYLSLARTGPQVRPITTASGSKALAAPSTHASASRREISSRLGTTHGAPFLEARP